MSKNTIHDNFRVYNLKKFIASLDVSAGNTLYLGIGRPQVWSVSDDNNEPQPNNDTDTRNSVWEDMCSMKRVSTSDVCHGISRETWKANTKYDQYRHDWGLGTRNSVYYTTTFTPSSLLEAKYYVINSNDDVFICVKQGVDSSGVVKASTFEPGLPISGTYVSSIDTGAGIFVANDGYVWKYIGTVSNTTSKFRTTFYDGIKTLTEAPSPTTSAYNQWLSQINSANYKQGIYAINVLTKGTGYNGGVAGFTTHLDSTFKVVGNGTGLEFTVTYGSGGTVENIDITNPGRDYTFASIESTTGSGGVFDIIFTSETGLGTDPVKDLSAIFLLINVELNAADGLMSGNNYRKVSLCMNPLQYGSSSQCTASTLTAMTTLNMTGHSGETAFLADQIVTGLTSTAMAQVVQWDYLTDKLKVIKNRDMFDASNIARSKLSIQALESITQNVGGPATVASIDPPTVQPFSGDIIYSDNRPPVMRNDASYSDNVSIIIQF